MLFTISIDTIEEIMRNFSYTVSAQLKNNLQDLDSIRAKLLTTPLSPKDELRIKWEAIIDRVYFSIALTDNKIKQKEVSYIISNFSILKKPKSLTTNEKNILKYKKAIDLINQNWLVTDKILTPKVVIALHEVGCTGTYKKKDTELKQILDYAQAVGDHPAIQAAIVYVAIIDLHAFSDGNEKLASLLSLLFLYKHGFDVRGIICIEKQWLLNQTGFKEALNQGINSAHATLWIEYFTKSLLEQLKQKYQDITELNATTKTEKKFFKLNERQKIILTLLEEPNTTITNRVAQKHFEISQITASRDLARLSALGLLVAHGRGRSIYYSKV